MISSCESGSCFSKPKLSLADYRKKRSLPSSPVIDEYSPLPTLTPLSVRYALLCLTTIG